MDTIAFTIALLLLPQMQGALAIDQSVHTILQYIVYKAGYIIFNCL